MISGVDCELVLLVALLEVSRPAVPLHLSPEFFVLPTHSTWETEGPTR
jgi:hypothetical protein